MKKVAVLSLVLLTLAGTLSMRADQEGPYTYIVTNGQAIITGFDGGYSGDLIITNTLVGYPVTAIGDWAFFDCYKLTSVVIPDSVITIGDGAFANCGNLTNVVIGNSVTTIGDDGSRVVVSPVSQFPTTSPRLAMEHLLAAYT